MSEPIVSDDFFHGDIRRGIEAVRQRLLDLSNRNRLLNFTYPRRSRSYLRVVDELPDQLCGALLDGRELRLDPVPIPTRRQLEAWREERLATLRERFGDDPEKQIDARAEALAEPTAEEFARRLGIRADYELPVPPTGEEELDERHYDRLIQTLHFPQNLERIASHLASRARLAIQESGTNMLHLAFGVLERYDASASDVKRLAPLYLLPVMLNKGQLDRETSTYRYSISYSGEDLLANISLQEKLKRDFQIAVPDLKDEELPEAYIARVREAISTQPQWSVHRHATLCMLSFGKLLMYRDLDAQNWPGDGLTGNPRIKDFFIGTERGSDIVAEEYEIDKTKKKVPLLIDDADSSQHSALVDAVAGKNLVIQGPPGTGKSQTITNLIAAALADGKTVLFMAEKLAALEVVKKRLERAGLGVFCLELHSHKTRKKEFLNDVERRLALRETFRGAAELGQLQKELENYRDNLNRYAELINGQIGHLNKSIYDVLWAAKNYERRLGASAEKLKTIVEARAELLTTEELATTQRTLRRFGDALVQVRQSAAVLDRHPWSGVTNRELTFLDKDRVVTLAGDALDSVRRIDRAMGQTPREVAKFCEKVEALPDPPGAVPLNVLKALRSSERRSDVGRLLEDLERFRSIHADVGERSAVVAEAPIQARAHLTECEALLRQTGKESLTQLKDLASAAPAAMTAVVEARTARDFIKKQMGVHLGPTVDSHRLATSFCNLAGRAPVEHMHLIEVGNLNLDDLPKLERLAETQEELHKRGESLAHEFHVTRLPSENELRDDAEVLGSAGLFWWLSPRVWRARRRYQSLAVTPRHRSNRARSDRLFSLMEFTRARREFQEDRALHRIAGEHASGLSTPIQELLTLFRFRRELVLLARESGPEGNELLKQVDQLDTISLETLRRGAATQADRESLEEALKLATVLLGETVEMEGLEESMAAIAGEIRKVADWGSDSGLMETTPKEVAELLGGVEALLVATGSVEAHSVAAGALNELWKGTATDAVVVEYASEYASRVIDAELPDQVSDIFLGGHQGDALLKLRQTVASQVTALGELDASFTAFDEVVGLDVREWGGSDGEVSDVQLDAFQERLRTAIDHRAQFDEWVELLTADRAIPDGAAREVAEAVRSGVLSPEWLADGYAFVVFESLARRALRDQPELTAFRGLDHERLRKAYQETDLRLIELYREWIAARLDRRPVPSGNRRGRVSDYTDLALIEHEVAKQKRHIPIRQLMRRTGMAMQALKPCFMMGPLSVAQYLEPGMLTFDLIVMDEASQLRPEEALGAIGRGAQLVVVGDSQQLPPTRFFERIDDTDDDEGQEFAEGLLDAESILDIAASAYGPTRMLRWHYRSRHPSLIAFSNKQFYGGNLVLFPAPELDSRDLGVHFHRVGGIYKNSRNPVEGATVVQFTLRHMRERPDESIGIAAMNVQQRDLIEDEFDDLSKGDPVVRAYIARWDEGIEPFFIKNLENVQGDERDVIVISVTYGPDENGRVYQRFGPINGPTGHRRLNVLISRARNRVEVFSSMRAADVTVTEHSSLGVAALKGYLTYAETGVLDGAYLTGREPDSDFEVEVAQALGSRGLEVVAQVGVAGYFLDLAIRHPKTRGRFILGVECDGATYHSAKSARDRDRLRQEVLQDKGWNIERVWSTDWFRDPGRETERIVRRVWELVDADPESVVDVAEDRDDVELVMAPLSRGEAEVPPHVEPPAASIDWISADEAREELESLRGTLAETFADVPPEEGILRSELLEYLLRERPTTREEWLRKIPLDLRIETAPEHMVILDDIVAVLARIRRTD